MTTYNPIAARDIRVQDTSGRESWAAIARQYQERTAEAARTDVFGLDMFPDRYRARYARTESSEGGVIVNPRWPDGCPLTLDELAHPEEGHVDHAGGESLSDGPLYWPSCGHFSETYAHGPQCPANRAYAGGGE